MPSAYVFDSYAFLDLFENGPGADEVAAIIADPGAEIAASTINLGEVYYILLRRRGDLRAREIVETIFRQPNLRVIDASWARVRDATELKAGGGLSFADAFAAGLAREINAPIVTGDPEFAPLERHGLVQVHWFPRT